MNPTKQEKEYWSRIAEFGCIACRIDGYRNPIVSIHHCDGRTKKGAHMKVIALCFNHHQSGSETFPSIHPWKKQFENKYGKQEYLIKMTNDLLGA